MLEMCRCKRRIGTRSHAGAKLFRYVFLFVRSFNFLRFTLRQFAWLGNLFGRKPREEKRTSFGVTHRRVCTFLARVIPPADVLCRVKGNDLSEIDGTGNTNNRRTVRVRREVRK